MIRRTPLVALAAWVAGCAPMPGHADVQRFTLPTGARVLVQREPDAGQVAVCVFVRAGAAEEAGKPGVGSLAARALFGDNTNMSSATVSHDIWMVGGGLETRWEPDYTLIRFVTSRQGFSDAFYVVAQALKGAQFDPATLARARADLLAELGRRAANPFDAAYTLLRPALYVVSPYRSPAGGTPDGVRRMTRDAVADYYRRSFTPARTVVAVVGDIDPTAARQAIENQLLPDFDRPEPRARRGTAQPEEPLEDARRQGVVPGGAAVAMAGYRWPGVCDADYAPGLVLAALVGGGKGSRLFRTVRDTLGVGYGVGTLAQPLAHESHMLGWVQYDASHPGPDGKPIESAAVERLLTEAVESVLRSPPTERELLRARRYAAGTDALAHQRAADRAFYLGWYESLGAGYEADRTLQARLDAVTAEDVMRVARQCLAHRVVAAVGPARP